ncbi:hypothetical protein MTR_5g045890 [Medicago truncatula]|uniref:Uncharacterized protein n=1 Tax=Medicago truncatula TaxID=3880 RepID=G7JZ55_MEDTR|nr:hypothetical protein MTR_5g045890 [Medicago truncatula]
MKLVWKFASTTSMEIIWPKGATPLTVHDLEYWRPRIFFAIASSVGTPVCTDSASSKPMIERTFSQFARVLVRAVKRGGPALAGFGL